MVIYTYNLTVAVHPPFLTPSMTKSHLYLSFSVGLRLFCSGEMQNSRRFSKLKITLCYEKTVSSSRLSTGSLRRLHHDWCRERIDEHSKRDENCSWRAWATTTLWGKHGKSVSVLGSLNRSSGKKHHQCCCPFRVLCSRIWDIRSSPCSPSLYKCLVLSHCLLNCAGSMP